MSKFLNLITAANAASAASSAYELRQRQEEYAQEAWEREEARKEREEEKSRQREERQAADEEKKEREKRWDYKTEGIRGGIEAIMKYRDPSFRFKLLKWHKEGMLRTEDEVEEIKSLMSGTVDLIITNELNNILAGERDDPDEINPDSRAYHRAHLLEMLRINVLNNNYIHHASADVSERFNEACESTKALLKRIAKKKDELMLCEAYRDTFGLIRARKFHGNRLRVFDGIASTLDIESGVAGICVFNSARGS